MESLRKPFSRAARTADSAIPRAARYLFFSRSNNQYSDTSAMRSGDHTAC